MSIESNLPDLTGLEEGNAGNDFVSENLTRAALVWFCLLMFLTGPVMTRALNWETGEGYRSAPVSLEENGRTGFQRLSPESTGVEFVNTLAEDRSLTNRVLLSGSGVAAGDVDGDGRCDLYFCRYDGENVLYRNLGDWRFEEVTRSAGVSCPDRDSTGALFADVDGDSDLDLLVTALGHGVRLFENDGKARFEEVTDAAGLRSTTGAMSMAVADLNGDKRLDLYVTNYRPTTVMDQPQTKFQIKMVQGRPVVAAVNGRPATSPELTNRFVVSPSGNVLEWGEVDQVYFNQGEGRFEPVAFTGGRFLNEAGNPLNEPPRDWGLAVQVRDFTGDGLPDIYVCNDLFTPDRIWVGEGNGTFRALPRLALRNTSGFSMGVDFADIDRDGDVDFFVTDMLSPDHQNRQVQVAEKSSHRSPVGMIENRPQLERNTLQVNRGDNTFAETAYYSGVEASDWSWGPAFLDVDLDGYEDILIPNGQQHDVQNADMAREIEKIKATQKLTHSEITKLVKLFPKLEPPNLAFRNQGDLTFKETGAAWGFDHRGISQGMALADLDQDGDLDVVVNNLNAPAGLYRNVTTAPRVAVRLKGKQPNTQGIGARIRVTGGPVFQSQEMLSGGRYLSDDESLRVFAAGNDGRALNIAVDWPGGGISRIEGAEPNRIYRIEESSAKEGATAGANDQGEQADEGGMETAPNGKGIADPDSGTFESQLFFEEVSSLLEHEHPEQPFDDFERQPLLPRQLSRLGPGVGWDDLNGDGWDDLIIGTGRGGSLALYLNNAAEGFRRIASEPATDPTPHDYTTLLGWPPDPKRILLVAGLAQYEIGVEPGLPARIYDLTRAQALESLPEQSSSTGPLAMADIDGDGDLDLFIGGRVVPGRYPEPADSMLLRNEDGQFVLERRWKALGLVSGAVFSDLDGDGLPELILACDWGPVRVWQRENGEYREVTASWGLDRYRGWWNGVTTGDMDGDGDQDIIATNWGLNHRYHHLSDEHPLRLYYGDLDDNGTLDLVQTYYDQGMQKEVPERGLRSAQSAMPFLQTEIPSFKVYGGSSVREIYGERLNKTEVLEVNTLESMVFINQEESWSARPLPREAQLSPAFGVSVADLDGDGAEDLFLSQNFYGNHPEVSRDDAGRGLWLKGDGHGGFEPVPGQVSGIKVYGEQRGCAVGDYDRDGREDLVVTQNGNRTKLYRNVRGKPGLRVRLMGTPENPDGVGTVMRLRFDEDRLGSAHEIHAGSGYWSQESAYAVLATPEAPTGIWLRWPGGETMSPAVPKEAHEIVVTHEGNLHVVK